MESGSKAAKILVIQGSPRKKGNSIALAEQIIRGAESAGAEVEKIFFARQGYLTLPSVLCMSEKGQQRLRHR